MAEFLFENEVDDQDVIIKLDLIVVLILLPFGCNVVLQLVDVDQVLNECCISSLISELEYFLVSVLDCPCDLVFLRFILFEFIYFRITFTHFRFEFQIPISRVFSYLIVGAELHCVEQFANRFMLSEDLIKSLSLTFGSNNQLIDEVIALPFFV